MEICQPSARDHALSHGLTVDIDNFCVHNLDVLLQSLQQTTYPTTSEGLTDSYNFPQLVIPSVLLPLDPQTPQHSSTELLTECLTEVKDVELQQLALLTSLPAICKGLTWELPILQSDPDLDLKYASREVSEALDVRLSRYLLPLEPLDEGKDEGLSFSRATKEYQFNLENDLQTDELDYSGEDLTLLTEALDRDLTAADADSIREVELNYPRIQALCFTPELTPIDETYDPFVPDAAVCQLDIPSDPSSLLNHDLDKIESTLKDTYGDSCSHEISSHFLSTLSTSPMQHIHETSPSHLKTYQLLIESPVMWDGHSSPPTPIFHGSLSRRVFESMPLASSTADGEYATLVCGEEGSFRDQLNTVLQTRGAHAMRTIEQERLDAIDTDARLAVPVLNFDVPRPKWQDSAKTAEEMFQWIHGYYPTQFDVAEWPKNTREERKLWWTPFKTGSPRLALQEVVGDQSSLTWFLQLSYSSPILTSADFVWKRPGLAILQANYDDDEIAIPELFSTPTTTTQDDILSLVKRNRMEIDRLKPTENPTGATPNSQKRSSLGVTDAAKGALLFGDFESNAAGKLLDNYISLHVHKKVKLGTSKFFSCPEGISPASSGLVKSSATIRPLPPDPTAKVAPLPAPCPSLQPQLSPNRLIISITVGRPLIFGLQRLLPEVDLLDRDFSTHDVWIWSPNSTEKKRVVSSLAFEADILVSPDTGLVVTTMSKIRQKPIPGSDTQTQIRERVANVASLYKRLIVLVSENNQDGEYGNSLNDSDAQAYADFVAFTSSFGATIRTYYIAGGNQTLVKWAAWFICQYAQTAAEHRDFLTSEESSWEITLRRAGMNVYAAQVLIGILKSQYGNFGLMRFLMMPACERIAVFERYIGGRYLLDRANLILDQSWI